MGRRSYLVDAFEGHGDGGKVQREGKADERVVDGGSRGG